MKPTHKSWNKQEILRLIQRYQQYEILWNNKIPQYKNRALKQESLKELSLEFKTPVSEIQRKVHNLRCQLNSEVKKLKKRKSAGVDDGSLKSSWEYFEPLLFILSATCNEDDDIDGFDASEHLETLIETDENASIQQEEENDYEDSSRIVGEIKTEPDSLAIQSENDLSQDVNCALPGCSQLNEVPFDAVFPRMRRITAERNHEVKRSTPLKKKYLDMNVPRDDCQIFGDFVAAELRNLKSDENRRKLKRAIQRAVLDISESEG